MEAVRAHAVYSGTCALLLRMAATWAAAATAALRAAADAGASAHCNSPSLTTASRLLAAMRLLVATSAQAVDSNSLASAVEDLEQLAANLTTLEQKLQEGLMAATPATSASALTALLATLPEAELVRGCAAFPQWSHSSQTDADALTQQEQAAESAGTSSFGISRVRLTGLSHDCAALAAAAADVKWHARTAACGNSLSSLAGRLAERAAPPSRHGEGRAAPVDAAVDAAVPAQPVATQGAPVAAAERAPAAQPSAGNAQAAVASGDVPQRRIAGANSDDDLDEVVMPAGQGWGDDSCHDNTFAGAREAHHQDLGGSDHQAEAGYRGFDNFDSEPAAAALSTQGRVERPQAADHWHSSNEEEGRAVDARAAPGFFATPPREHESLARELHLPSSLHLGVRDSSDDQSGEGSGRSEEGLRQGPALDTKSWGPASTPVFAIPEHASVDTPAEHQGGVSGDRQAPGRPSYDTGTGVERLSIADDVGLPASLHLGDALRGSVDM